MDRSNIEKIAQDPEDRFLLAKLYDKIQTGIRRNIPVDTCFLSPRELELCRYLFGKTEGQFFLVPVLAGVMMLVACLCAFRLDKQMSEG